MNDKKQTQYIAGIDVGNSTTEVALVEIGTEVPYKWWSACVSTSGVKGTSKNIKGLMQALNQVAIEAQISLKDISLALINNATPVIGDFAM